MFDLMLDNIRPPAEAYNFDPSPYLKYHGKGKDAQRFIFTNQIITDFEDEKLKRLEAELQKSKINPYEKHPEWTRADLLRFCYGTGWKTRVAKDVLLKYLKWHDTIMPTGYMALFPKVEHLLVNFN
jgi:hypothetical protein